MSPRAIHDFRPDEEQMALWPKVSGNSINGLSEAQRRRPTPIYWHAPDATPHGPLQRWFYARTNVEPAVQHARAERQSALDEPLAPLAAEPRVQSATQWTTTVKRLAREYGADSVGVTAMRPEYVFEGHQLPTQSWMVILAVRQRYEEMATAPSTRSLVEVTRQYTRGNRIAMQLASALRQEGHDATPYGGPMAGSFLLIPAAIAAGLGELGKHGSLIHRELGSNFRLACVLTDLPLIADQLDSFGADDFCARCRICTDACPPDAISAQKQLVRGDTRWYVDFDKCLPYFNENMSCAICVTVCPFSRPGMGPQLVQKLTARRSR